MAETEAGQWFWCLEHQRPEREGACRAEQRMGPYASEQEARDWQAQNQERNRSWDEEDERWSGNPT